MADIKWSAFTGYASPPSGSDVLVGLHSGGNVKFTAPFGNLGFSGNNLISQNAGGNINIVPSTTGITLVGSSTAILPGSTLLTRLQLAASGKQAVFIQGSYINGTNGSNIVLFKSRSTTIGAFVAVQNGDSLGQVNFAGDEGSEVTNCAGIRSTVTGSVSSGIIPSNLTFLTTDTSGGLNTAMTISSSQIVTLTNALPVTSGGTGLQSTTVNQILYSSSANTIAGLATANNGVLVTSGAGVPSISTTLPTGLAMQTPASLVLTNATGLPRTSITGLGTGVATALGVNTNSTGGFPVETDGTFVPALAFGGASVGITYSTQSGQYTRIGNLVYFQIAMILTSKGSSTGVATITSLPFTSRAGATYSINTWYPSGVSYLSAPLIGFIGGNTSIIGLQYATSGGAATNLTDASFVNASQIYISGCYII